MNTFVSQHPAALALEAMARALAATARAARRTAARLDCWIAKRRREARDLRILAAMTDRELADIGIARGNVTAVASGAWQRER
jgi:uncharacterized protein YjiS (DUF1127 family)